ncbi:ECF-type sigma factor [Clostridioides difficile]|nr:response regulator receiver protein [Clostridioides difficile]MDV5911822.1 ECF-type sigma factor [Clostridioides difficile]
MRRQENRRNKNGLTSREQEKHNRINDIQVEKLLGLSQSKVAKKLNLSISTVKRYWNF